MRIRVQILVCSLLAGFFLLFANVGRAADTVAGPQTVDEARATLDGLASADLKSDSPRLDAVMKMLFPSVGQERPCDAPGQHLSSAVLCEWHAPGKPHSVLPDMFVSFSASGLDSAVAWGAVPLNKATWQCEIAPGHFRATVCVPWFLKENHRKNLLREWRIVLAEIMQSANETPAK